MKRLLVFFLAPIVVMGLATLALLLLTDQPVNTSRRPIVTCPIEAKAEFAKTFDNKWLIWTEDGNVKAPSVRVDQSKSAASGMPFSNTCELSFKAHEAGQGIDWRIGNTAVDVAPFRGKMVQLRVWVKSSVPVELSTGTAYFYDGRSVTGKAVRRIDQNWQTIDVIGPVSKDAGSFESWFRLVLGDGTIKPQEGKIHFAMEVSPSDRPYEAPTPPAPAAASPFVAHRCPVEMSDSVLALTGSTRTENKWTSYRFDGSKPAPEVIAQADGVPFNGKPTCRLKYFKAPSSPGSAVDWRIGFQFPDAAVFRGKEVTLTIAARAEKPISLDTGSIYIYDGHKVAQIPVTKIGPEWTDITISSPIDPSASVLQGWFRLLLGQGTIVPADGEIDFLARFDVLP